MYSSKWIHRCQTLWIATMLAAGIIFLYQCAWSLWITIPLAIIGFLLLSWVGISIISLFDHNHRKAMKYSIKIENIPLYLSLFDSMVEMEQRGIDTSGIPAEVKDVDEWLRFCRWQIEEGITNLSTNDEY